MASAALLLAAAHC